MSTHIVQGWRLARRELRGGLKSLRIVLACLALGVAAITAVGTLRAATQAGLQADGARLLGGDIEIRTSQRPLPHTRDRPSLTRAPARPRRDWPVKCNGVRACVRACKRGLRGACRA